MAEKKMFDNDLDPEVEKVRDQIIKKIGDKPLEEVNQIIKKLLNEQMDEVARLGALAARVKIIRAKIEVLYDGTFKKQKNVDLKSKKSSEVDKESNNSTGNWVRVKMLETGDINGKQIDKGVILDVQEEDATKLVQTKKAEIVDLNTDGASPITKNKEQKKEENLEEKQEQPKKDFEAQKDEVTAGELNTDKKLENKDDIDNKKVELESDKESIKKSEGSGSSNKISEKENEKSEEELLKIHEEREKKKIEEQKKVEDVDEKQEQPEKDVEAKKNEDTTGNSFVDKKPKNKDDADNEKSELESKKNEGSDNSNNKENKDN